MEHPVKFEHFTTSAFSKFDSSSFNKLLAREADESPYNGYIPLSPIKSDLRKSSSQEYLLIRGKIFDKSGSWPVGNAGIEVWHLTPGTRDFKHRAKLISDSTGAFQLITDLPARQPGHNFKVFFKISVGVITYYTHLSFNHSMAWLAKRTNNQFHGPVPTTKSTLDTANPSIFKLEIRLNH